MKFETTRTTLVALVVLFFAGCNCSSKVYSDEQMAIDPKFASLFRAVLLRDTLCFVNPSGRQKMFTVTNIDSIISNSKGGFINEAPYKLLRINYREVGRDTSKLERRNEIFVNKDPASGNNTLCIKFNNLYYYTDNDLPVTIIDSVNLITAKIAHFYRFQTSTILKNPDDVKSLYINEKNGIMGFETLSGETWENCSLSMK